MLQYNRRAMINAGKFPNNLRTESHLHTHEGLSIWVLLLAFFHLWVAYKRYLSAGAQCNPQPAVTIPEKRSAFVYSYCKNTIIDSKTRLVFQLLCHFPTDYVLQQNLPAENAHPQLVLFHPFLPVKLLPANSV